MLIRAGVLQFLCHTVNHTIAFWLERKRRHAVRRMMIKGNNSDRPPSPVWRYNSRSNKIKKKIEMHKRTDEEMLIPWLCMQTARVYIWIEWHDIKRHTRWPYLIPYQLFNSFLHNRKRMWWCFLFNSPSDLLPIFAFCLFFPLVIFHLFSDVYILLFVVDIPI